MIHVPALEILAEGSQMTPSSKWINHSHMHATGVTPCHTSTTRPVPSPFIWYEGVSILLCSACSASVAFRLQQAHDVERSDWRIILLNADGVTNEGTRSHARIVRCCRLVVATSQTHKGLMYQLLEPVSGDLNRWCSARYCKMGGGQDWVESHTQEFHWNLCLIPNVIGTALIQVGVKALLLITAC